MLLRESGTLAGESYDLTAITEKGSGGGGVPHGETLLGFTEALMDDDEAALDRARQEVLELGCGTITPAGAILDPGAGFLVWFSQKSGTSRGVAALLSGSSGKQIPIGFASRLPRRVSSVE